jgi:hypothetical protein
MKIKNLLDNRIFQIICLPLAIYNTYKTRQILINEHSLLVEAINTNEEFFKAIATMNFTESDKSKYVLTTEMSADPIFTLEEIQTIAKETIIKTILEFVKSEMLLGILIVKCEFIDEDNSIVKILIEPSHYQLYLNDKQDVSTSIRLNIIFISIFLFLTWCIINLYS